MKSKKKVNLMVLSFPLSEKLVTESKDNGMKRLS
jgi:hypothetical protein